ncbi:phytanoyl-CoA dioxygenase family protein [Dyadobacter sp. CY351]|uniref:phytanoyl-CoA dioxygenase family protein n=1 Tax=Dyadobacter sp. CY351 TaxID=2909337 RepID=UPI001F21C2EB|nr:phytanoyl-CoA dioxygenase family protein [Dyadobacter sp. CY351]MCF2519148.1 phytanoyl-CoA dioxygenase family protein [Dyadobacter sp. CY351]
MDFPLFSDAFDRLEADSIAHELKYGKGYHVFDKALSPDAVNALINIVSPDELLVNNNNLGYVRAYWMKYLSHTLALSKECYDVITSERIRGICRSFFDRPFKISNQRIYETHTRSHLPWHTDNNLQSGNAYNGKHDLPGIMFLFYLSDVWDTNPFQLIPDSYKWSEQHTERFFSDKFIEKNYKDEIVTVRAPKGTLIVCNTHLIHRAEPFSRPGFRRLTYLFQIDEMSSLHEGHGEKILLNPAFVSETSPEILTYLGFGTKTNYPAFPETSVSTMLPHDIFSLQKGILPKAMKGLAFAFARSVIPGSVMNAIRKKIHKGSI